MVCKNCLHIEVCETYKATGGLKKCKTHMEKKFGYWVKVDDGNGNQWYECSECAIDPPRHKNGKHYFSDYCPNCGSEMKCVKD